MNGANVSHKIFMRKSSQITYRLPLNEAERLRDLRAGGGGERVRLRCIGDLECLRGERDLDL